MPLGEEGASFEIKIIGKGNHEFLCMATNVDLESYMPASLRVNPLTPIASAGSLNKILSDLQSKAQGLVFGFSTKKITGNN